MRSRLTIGATIVAMFLLTIPASADNPHQEYIVVLNPTERPVPDVANEIASLHGGEVGFIYTSALQGFTLEIPEPAVAGLSRNPRVAYIEPVVEVEAVGTQPIPTGIDRIEWDLNSPTVPMDVDIAILDTGVYIGTNPDGTARSHLDLNLRYVSDCTQAIFYPLFGSCSGSGDFQDYHGHGTHVAGIAAAYDNDIGSIGVAPGATLWSFKVLQQDGTGTSGMILAGIDGVAAKADQIEVANMSLGFVGTSQAIDDAIAAATDVGVTFVVAAGNNADDASTFSPANGPDVITVSAIADFDGLPGGQGAPTCRDDVDDTLADFSNFGSAVEIAAPGACIYSTHLNDGYAWYSGTSMASPFVAGAVARYIAETGAATNNRADVEAIKAAIIGDAVPQASACGFTDVQDGSPEPLLFLNGPAFGGDGTCEDGSTVNASPTADFSYVCTDLSCEFADESTDADGTIVSRAWNFGDGEVSAEASPTHVFSSSGDYTVQLTVTDDGGASATKTEVVSVSDGVPVNNPPSASFTSSCSDLTCNFTNTSFDDDGDSLTYIWDFGDDSTSSAENPTHTYSAGATYNVTLSVSDGQSTSIANGSVTVEEAPTSSVLTAAVYPILLDGRDASVSVGVFDSLGEFVADATVEATWTYLDRHGREKTATESAVTSAEPVDGLLGNVVFSRRFPPNSTVVTFCVTGVTAPGYEYTQSISCGEPYEG